jgi:hypothetical protein
MTACNSALRALQRRGCSRDTCIRRPGVVAGDPGEGGHSGSVHSLGARLVRHGDHGVLAAVWMHPAPRSTTGNSVLPRWASLAAAEVHTRIPPILCWALSRGTGAGRDPPKHPLHRAPQLSYRSAQMSLPPRSASVWTRRGSAALRHTTTNVTFRRRACCSACPRSGPWRVSCPHDRAL